MARPLAAVALSLASMLVLAPVAWALEEAQITKVSCTGLTVTQRGLAPNLEVAVVVLDAPRGVKLIEVDSRTDSRGRLGVAVAVDLRRVRQIVVEVERRSDEAEFGEAAADLPQPCTRTPVRPVLATGPPAGSTASAPAPPAQGPALPGRQGGLPANGSDGGTDTSQVPWIPLVAAVSLVGAIGVVLVRRRRV